AAGPTQLLHGGVLILEAPFLEPEEPVDVRHVATQRQSRLLSARRDVEYVPVFGAHAARTGVRIMPTPNFFSHGPFLSTLAAISRTPFAEKCPRTPRRICATREIVLGPRDDAATAGKNPRGRPKILSVRAIRDRRERMPRPPANRRRGTCDGGPQRPKKI